ncbi:hypothetical protein COC97_23080 [Bacillus anthracis]|nr:hypothetical protein COC97_23080 [Bacillus anthracis]
MTNKKTFEVGDIMVHEYPRLGDYDAISFSKGEEMILVLGVSGTAQVSADCGLKGLDIQQWLLEKGSSFVNEISETKKLMITSNDVLNGELNTHWSQLKEME